ncbi:MAG: GGDEF domain-containing protein [Desulfovibrio sp.]
MANEKNVKNIYSTPVVECFEVQKEVVGFFASESLDAMSESLVDKAIDALRTTLERQSPLADLHPFLRNNEKFVALLQDVVQLKKFALSLAQGDLSQSLPLRGEFSGALKTLQADLKHLVWQAKMISESDFSQRVDFMGEFAEAFNNMATQLDCLHKELIASQNRYKKLATIDQLTELYNRRYFFDCITEILSSTEGANKDFSIILLDIDNFKNINDSYGHDVGDIVLREIALILKYLVRKIDKPCRFGGEEFVVLLPNMTMNNTLVMAERIREYIATHTICFKTYCINITASFGVSSYQDDVVQDVAESSHVEKLIHNADKALYQAKRSGKNRIASSRGFFSPEILADHVRDRDVF